MNQNDELFEKLKLKQEKITASVTDPITNDLIKYNIVNKTNLWRAETLFNKEPIPSYLKIDVDGIESKIIAEAKKTLSDPTLESVLIEINENREEDIFIINSLKKIGFSYNKNQVEDAKRKSGPHKGYAEYLFYK